MKPKIKKILLVLAALFLIFIGSLVALPYFFKDKIMLKAKTELNKMLNANVYFSDVDMSFIRNFPYASVKLNDFHIVGKGDFEKDTLLSSQSIHLVLNVKSLFSDKGYDIRKLAFTNSRVMVHVLADGQANYLILKEDSAAMTDTTAMNFHWKLKEFNIENADILYKYDKSNMQFVLKNVNHTTSGDLTADSSLLVTTTSCDSLSFLWEGIEYISKAKARLDADINANLNDMHFTISKNSSQINEIPFSLEGWLKSISNGWDMDLKLVTSKVGFKELLSMVPSIYAKSFDELKAGGKVDLKGSIKGTMIDDYYPSFQLKLVAENGWFQYTGLPESVKNINVAMDITNPGKTLDETVIDISRFSLTLGGNPFNAQMRIAYPMTDTEISAKMGGLIDLGSIKKVYPLEAGTQLNGQLNLKLDLAGRMSYLDNNDYDKFKFAGLLKVNNLLLKSKMLPQDVSVSNANLLFNNRTIDLSALKMTIGKNDLSASGKLTNVLPYLFQNKVLTGELTLHSDYLNISDFMSTDSASIQKSDVATVSTPMNIIQIPKNLNFQAKATVKKLMYEKMSFSNVSGGLTVKDSELRMEQVNLNGFGGNLVMNGSYNVSDALKPKVSFDLSLKEILFNEIFTQVETLTKFVPLFEKASGKFSTKLSFNSLLKSNMMPDLQSVLSSGTFSTQSVGLKNVPAMEMLATALKKGDIMPMNIKDIIMLFEIKNGKLTTKPFNFKVSDLNFTLGGITGLDQTIDYKGIVKLPDSKLPGKLSTVNFKIGGTFSKPKIELDLKNTIDEIVTDAKKKIETDIKEKTEQVKDKALDEAIKQKEKAMKEAQLQADKLLAETKRQGDALIAQAKKQGEEMVAKTTNPLTKKAAQMAASKLEQEARKKADQLNLKAAEEAEKIIQRAADKVKIEDL